MNAITMGVIAWLAAAAVATSITTDGIFAPLRVVHEKRQQHRAELLRRDLNDMAPDDPRRWRKGRAYEWRLAWAAFPSCRRCIGFWTYLVAAVVLWVALGRPGLTATLWGGPVWFMLPGAMLASWIIYIEVIKVIDPPATPLVQVLRD